VLQRLRSGELDDGGLLELFSIGTDRGIVSDSGVCRGAIYGYPAPGKIGVVYPAGVDAELGAEAATMFYQQLERFLVARGCNVLQVIGRAWRAA